MLGMTYLTQLSREAELSVHPISRDNPLIENIDDEIERLGLRIDEIPMEVSVAESILISDAILDKLLLKLRNADATAYDDAAILQNASDTELVHAFKLIERFEFDEATRLIEHILHKEKT
jgi:hypothetical protein